MDRLRTLRIFISAAELGSFAEAGRRLAFSPTTVTRTIAALEAELGVPLFMRTTRSVRLTPEGAAFLERCQAGIAEIDLAFATAQGGGKTPRGVLAITAPVMFGRLHVVPIVTEMLGRYPELQIRLLLLDRLVSLVEEGVDIAIRIGELPDSALHSLRIGQVRRVLSASPGYLDGVGRPGTIAELGTHHIIAVQDEAGPRRDWNPVGRPPRLIVNNVDAAIAAAIAGLGVVSTLSYQIADHLAAGRLERVLPEEATPALPVSLLFQSGRKDRPNIRAFIGVAQLVLGGGAV